MERLFGLEQASLYSQFLEHFASQVSIPSFDSAGVKMAVELPAGTKVVQSGARLTFPHFGDGVNDSLDLRIQTILFLVNNTPYESAVTVRFYGDDGQPVELEIAGTVASLFRYTLGGGETRRITTAGKGAIQGGWVDIRSAQPLAGTCLFSLSDRAGHLKTEVGVSESPLAPRFTMFADTRSSVTTGLSVVNMTVNPLTLTLELRDLGGNLKATATKQLQFREHWARYLEEIFAGYAGIQNFQGTVLVKGNRNFAGITLRADGELLTSVPMIVTPPTDLARTRMVFPHLAEGKAGDLAIGVTVLLVNTTTNPVAGQVVYWTSAGQPWAVKIGSQTSTSFPFSLAPGEMISMMTQATGTVKTGWAMVESDATVEGSAIFHIREANGPLLAEVGVASAPVTKQFDLVADNLGAAGTGVALTNITNGAMNVEMELRQLDGTPMATEVVELPASGHSSFFIDQLFDNVAGIAEFQGSVHVSAESEFGGLSLRQTGVITTSLPVMLPQLGFSPNAVFRFDQNLAGTTPSSRIDLFISGTDLAMSSMEATVPEVGLDLSGTAVGDTIAYGFLSVGAQGILLGGTTLDFVLLKKDPIEIRNVPPYFSKDFFSVEVSGEPEGNLRIFLQLGFPGGPAMAGLGFDTQIELHFPPGTAVLPSAAKDFSTVIVFNSAGTRSIGLPLPVKRQITLAQKTVTPAPSSPILTYSQPIFLVAGKLIRLHGEGLGSVDGVTFPTLDGEQTWPPTKVIGDQIDVLVPQGVAHGSISVHSGDEQSNSLLTRALFAPRVSVLPDGEANAAGYPIKIDVEQDASELAFTNLDLTLFGAETNLSTRAVGSEVGRLQVLTNEGTRADFPIVVSTKATNLLELMVVDDGDPVATLQLEQIPGESLVTIDFNWEDAPTLSLGAASTIRIRFASLRTKLGLAGYEDITWTGTIRSFPPVSAPIDSQLALVVQLSG